MPLCAAEALTFRYPGEKAPALSGITTEIAEGEFLLLCGPSGCGKTTLLRCLKPALAPHGERSGRLLFDGTPLEKLDERRAAAEIGYVMQDPDSQLVTDEVWHELAFGLENLGLPQGEIRLRVAETASWFGLAPLFRKKTALLSGGQKQMVNLAAIAAMRPRLLLLDEPSSQLDPVAAASFLAAVRRLNRERGIAVLLAEHRLDGIFADADRVLLMEGGRLVSDAPPARTARRLREDGTEERLAFFLPAPARVHAALGGEGDSPLTLSEGKDFLRERLGRRAPRALPRPAPREGRELLRLKEVVFRYGKTEPDVLRGVGLTLRRGELCALVGPNGCGKSTLLSLAAGLLRPAAGRVLLDGKPLAKKELPAGTALLPQNPQTLFLRDSVGEDLSEAASRMELPAAEREARLRETVERLGLEGLLSRHPYDLSGGERQRAALARLLLRRPRLLLLDEPAKGLDPLARRELGELLRSLSGEGSAILAVTHDVEWAASFADRCALLFDGQLAAEGTPRELFSRCDCYTTAAGRMSRGLCENAVTVEDVIALCKEND